MQGVLREFVKMLDICFSEYCIYLDHFYTITYELFHDSSMISYHPYIVMVLELIFCAVEACKYNFTY